MFRRYLTNEELIAAFAYEKGSTKELRNPLYVTEGCFVQGTSVVITDIKICDDCSIPKIYDDEQFEDYIVDADFFTYYVTPVNKENDGTMVGAWCTAKDFVGTPLCKKSIKYAFVYIIPLVLFSLIYVLVCKNESDYILRILGVLPFMLFYGIYCYVVSVCRSVPTIYYRGK